MKIIVPEISLVALIGASGSGKSTFAKHHFLPTEVVSSDFCRGLISDDENDQSVTESAFELLNEIVGKRLDFGRLAVVDATNVQEHARKSLVDLARNHHALPVAIVFNMPLDLCLDRNRNRTDRSIPVYAIKNHARALRASLRNLKREGFRYIYVLNSPEDVDEATVERQPLWNNRKNEHGPFDIIGDIHGCFDELTALLEALGYGISKEDDEADYRFSVSHPAGRRLVFLGDLTDRGPNSPEVLRLVMDSVESGAALCVPGNHDVKLLRKLKGVNVQITHGIDRTLEQLNGYPDAFIQRVKNFIDGLVSHYVFDDGKLVTAHAGMKAEYQGRGSAKVRDFALYGETTGEIDEYGLPVRYDWATDYRGKALVVYGHTPLAEPAVLNNTINIDTGCVFGGKLTAYRYPEGEFVSVPAFAAYYKSAKPLFTEIAPAAVSDSRADDDTPDIGDVLGKKIVDTHLMKNVIIREENAMAALEVMSRFSADPRWIIYLPPTMSPCETSKDDAFLEHPEEAFSYYGQRDVEKVVCEQKHMGSRAVVIVCRTPEAALRRFGVSDDSLGICYTRTGRRFFDNAEMEAEFIDSIRQSLERSKLFDDFETDWVCLDCELMPWSAKAQELLKRQYAPVGVAGSRGLSAAVEALESAIAHGSKPFDVSQLASGHNANLSELLERFTQRRDSIEKYIESYRGYCWSVHSLADLRLAPFHILATERVVHVDKNHLWHMDSIKKYCADTSDIMIATNHIEVELANPESVQAGIDWWTKLTAGGGEGMVVKPLDFIARKGTQLLQPAVKCRGYEYLRIIYGPEYTMPNNISRLKNRSLGRKRSLALREFALGIEGLERFANHAPFYRVHECAFGVLALESEPVDPRL